VIAKVTGSCAIIDYQLGWVVFVTCEVERGGEGLPADAKPRRSSPAWARPQAAAKMRGVIRCMPWLSTVSAMARANTALWGYKSTLFVSVGGGWARQAIQERVQVPTETWKLGNTPVAQGSMAVSGDALYSIAFVNNLIRGTQANWFPPILT
jgi:hypothetical protein